MRIEVITTISPAALWTKIKKDITDENIKTWSVVKNNANNEYLTHNPPQWIDKALIKPTFETKPERLILTITWWKGKVPTEYIKGFYVGRFTEVLLEHYRSDYNKLETFA